MPRDFNITGQNNSVSRVVPNRILDRQAYEPLEQQVVRDLLDQLPLAADAVQHLQQHRPHQFLRHDAR